MIFELLHLLLSLFIVALGLIEDEDCIGCETRTLLYL